MKFWGYALSLIGWLIAGIIFRYALYPPQLMFWLVLILGSFVAAGLTQNKWAGVKVTVFVWVLIPFIQKVYPNNLVVSWQLGFSLLVSIFIAYIIGVLGAKIKLRIVVKGLTALILVFALLLGSLYYQVDKAGSPTTISKADAAIILGAAVWEGGRPSPSMAARVREGVKLYKAGLVENIIVSGGLGRIPPTEAEVMGELALGLGVFREHILLEKKAKSTEENISFSKAIGDKLGFKSYILVTDAFHIKRSLLMAKDFGLKAQGVPALESPLYTNNWLRFKYTLRETFGLVQYFMKSWLGKS